MDRVRLPENGGGGLSIRPCLRSTHKIMLQ